MHFSLAKLDNAGENPPQVLSQFSSQGQKLGITVYIQLSCSVFWHGNKNKQAKGLQGMTNRVQS